MTQDRGAQALGIEGERIEPDHLDDNLTIMGEDGDIVALLRLPGFFTVIAGMGLTVLGDGAVDADLFDFVGNPHMAAALEGVHFQGGNGVEGAVHQGWMQAKVIVAFRTGGCLNGSPGQDDMGQGLAIVVMNALYTVEAVTEV